MEGVWQIDSVMLYYPANDFIDTLVTEDLGVFDFEFCPAADSDEDCKMERVKTDGTVIPFLYNIISESKSKITVTLSAFTKEKFDNW
ncbi:MAG: hypothetical protein AAGC85_14670 [Bacteroidota bacterium]